MSNRQPNCMQLRQSGRGEYEVTLRHCPESRLADADEVRRVIDRLEAGDLDLRSAIRHYSNDELARIPFVRTRLETRGILNGDGEDED